MFSKELLKTIIIDQKHTYTLPQNFIERELQQELLHRKHDEINIITGLRRVGKSTLLLSLMKKIGGDYFINFDDDRLANFSIEDFQTLWEVFLELYGDQQVFCFDEIQNIKGWERFIRRLYDMGKQIFITGSNANLLSADLGTHLTGRYISYPLYPLSFQEFLNYKKIKFDINFLDTKSKIELLKAFKEYLNLGGIPKFVIKKEPAYLEHLIQDVIYRDVINKYKIKYVNSLNKLVKYAFSNFSRLISARKIAPIVDLKNHSTVISYLKYLEQAYVVFTVRKFAYSLKEQYIAPKKLYVIDLALAKQYGFSFSEDIGHKLENIVYLQLKRKKLGDIYYFSERDSECDFIIHNQGKVQQAIQVVSYVKGNVVKQREIKGLIKALNFFKLKQGIVITLDYEQELMVEGFLIKFIPAYKWLLM